jgi:hypothetical protein
MQCQRVKGTVSLGMESFIARSEILHPVLGRMLLNLVSFPEVEVLGTARHFSCFLPEIEFGSIFLSKATLE